MNQAFKGVWSVPAAILRLHLQRKGTLCTAGQRRQSVRIGGLQLKIYAIKKPVLPRAFLLHSDQCQLGMDSVYGAGIYACAAVDTSVGVDNTFCTLLADSINRTGILACCTISAIISNSMGHNFTSLLD